MNNIEREGINLLEDRLDESLLNHAAAMSRDSPTIVEIYQLQGLAEIHCYLKAVHETTPDEAEALLRFADPLEVAYDRQNLLIHDYFITKALDKVRPGGVVAFITTKGTMDKQNSKVRQDLAQKADLLGAIRLPNNAFKANAGTEVTTDILFFQKRASAPEKLPDWVQTGQTEDGVPLNSYFLQHPEMVLGTMSFWKDMYGNETETACLPVEGADLKDQLTGAVTHIAQPDRELLAMSMAEQDGKGEESIPADPNARNFSFVLSKGQIYFRENSRMKRVELGKTPTARVKGMVAIRDSARKIIDLQLNGAGDAELQAEQSNLSRLYLRQQMESICDAANNLLHQVERMKHK